MLVLRPSTVLLVLGLGACGPWPLSEHLDDDPRDLSPAPEDPRELVEVVWAPLAGAPVPSPADAPVNLLGVAEGRWGSSTLLGVGWADEATPEAFLSDDCPGAVGTRTPFPRGDYLGQVDYFALEAQEDGLLCASLLTDEPAIGWDLLVAEAGPCGLPLAFVGGAQAPLGYGLGGLEGGWSLPVTAGSRWVVSVAGYYPVDLTAELPYRLEVALVADSDDEEALCPLSPGDP